ncbi:MAG TPA: PsiF family protein [Luteibacter sp.]|uniref:PsiF family protein n=1 Tax=Luteibacter sp. TaxID=1886636 RepID=UPI002CCE5ED0|nr:PsiF family protein [Luteibacter sp.]HVI55520.1 PsiF family protein [Luteibacter sp.]
MCMQLRVLAVASLLAFSASAIAAPQAAKKELTPQQQRMSTCNTQATGKKGDDRKTFMSSCLKGETAAPAKQTQQQKMTSCNKDASAKSLKGAERKTFMSGCLKG